MEHNTIFTRFRIRGENKKGKKSRSEEKKDKSTLLKLKKDIGFLRSIKCMYIILFSVPKIINKQPFNKKGQKLYRGSNAYTIKTRKGGKKLSI